jgi:hypothetical protein
VATEAPMRLRESVVFLSIAACVAACGGGKGVQFAAAGAGGSSNSGGAATTTGPSNVASVGSGVTTGQGGSSTATTGSSVATTTATSSTSSGSTAYPAPFPKPPQVIAFGGPVLAHPKIYPVFFAGDDAATVASLTAFSQGIGATPYWTATTSEYGVGAATGEAAIKLTEAAPTSIDDSAIQTWLAQKFASDSGFPVPDDDTLIILYYPAGTSITLEGAGSCSTFGGYHNGATVGGGQNIAYAVVPRCDATVATATSAASHELIEASTDPYPMINPAYATVDDADYYWSLLIGGGEVGDMCESFPNVFVELPGFPYTVQRTWSNKQAAAGHDPCVPQPNGEVYFNAAPVMTNTAPLSTQGQTLQVTAVNIAVGGSMTIPVELFSDGPTGPWTVTAIDPAPMLANETLLTFGLDKTSGQNGDVLQLTINVLATSSCSTSRPRRAASRLSGSGSSATDPPKSR